MGKSFLTKHAQAYKQKRNTAFLTPPEPFSPAEQISAPTERGRDLPCEVLCPGAFLQPLPYAESSVGVVGHISVLQDQAANDTSGCLSGFVLCFTASGLQVRNSRSGCWVALQAHGQPKWEWELSPWERGQWKGQGDGAAPLPAPGPLHPHHPCFPRFHWLLDGVKGSGMSCLLLLGVLASSSGIVLCTKVLLFPWQLCQLSGFWAILPRKGIWEMRSRREFCYFILE